MTIKRHGSKRGDYVIDEPTNLPDGTEVEPLPLDPGDWLDDADRAALHKALRDSDADVAAGRLVDAEEILQGTQIALTPRLVRFTSTAQEHVRREKRLVA